MVVTTQSQSGQRDWTSLSSDIVALIANFLLADDLTHFVRFRSVCRNWRDYTAFLLKTHGDLFLPRDWIPLPSSPRRPPHTDQLEFFNTASGKRFSTEVSLLNSDSGYCFDDGFLYGMDFDRGLVRINLVLANKNMADPVVES